MTDIAIDYPTVNPKTQVELAWIMLAILMLLGLISFAATLESSKSCRPFTIGVSAVGSCDYIA